MNTRRVQPEQFSEESCWCTTCRPITIADMRFVVCPNCGNKRCPRAHNHELACTNSNEPGQVGSSWEHVKPWPKAQHTDPPSVEDCEYTRLEMACDCYRLYRDAGFSRWESLRHFFNALKGSV